jgi:hypothetical protein
MNTTMPDEALVAAVRTSSAETRKRILAELLDEHARHAGPWPVSVADRNDTLIALLIPRPGGGEGDPPILSPEREAELAERMKHLNEAEDLRDYVDSLDPDGRPS